VTLAAEASASKDIGAGARFSVPLCLQRTASVETAELWVLKRAGRAQLRTLVDRIDDRLLTRVSFAVAVQGSSEVVVVRLHSSRQLPVLLLDGIAFRSYLKLPTLFVPCGRRLQPALRRDTVRSLFSTAEDQITWLFPGEDGRFRPETAPASAFRPLDQWVEYQTAQPRVLSPWQQSSLFEMQLFVVGQEVAPPRPPIVRPAQSKKSTVQSPGRSEAPPSAGEVVPEQPPVTELPAPAEEEPPAIAPDATAELQQRLAKLQAALLDTPAPLDAAKTRDLWREMAALHAALGHAGDASLSWGYAFWEVDAVRLDHAVAWVRGEAPFNLDQLTADTPSPAGLRSLAAHLFHAACVGTPLDTTRLRVLQQLVEKHEAALPVRLAWLAHVALYRLVRGDVLALARARDRLLERLYQHGLRLEVDLPTFLRFSGKIGQDRLLAVRSHLARLQQHVRAWLRKHPRSPGTPIYADLTFAFALARLGASLECERLLAGTAKLKGEDDLHAWLHDAYAARIQQALRGEARGSALPASLVGRLDSLANDLRYKGDRLRQFSRILEPHEKIDARSRWHEHYPEAIERELAALSGLADPAVLWPRLGAMLEDKKKAYRPYRGVILARALELAPRLGEEFSRHVLGRVLPALADLTDSIEAQVLILEKGLHLAAHYDQQPHVVSFVDRFLQLLTSGTLSIAALEPLVGQLFLGLRKFGMREVVGQLLERLTALFLSGQDLKELRLGLARKAARGMLKQELSIWKALLHVASGWLYFGQEERARPILNETRTLLFQAVLHPIEQGDLACAYIRCLGQADMEPAIRRWLELFRKIERIDAVFTSDSHFSLAQLGLVEALVLTLVSDDFALDRQARHWLEDDEFHVRRRVHRDVRQAMDTTAGASR
jgi:hypothetical protein